MLKFNNSMTEVSAIENFETEIQKLQKRLSSQTGTISGKNSLISSASNRIIPSDYNFSNILKDYGDGRVSSGLKSCELLSLLCSGVTPQNLFLFDNIIYFGSPKDFLQSSEDQLAQLVIRNIGMTQITQSFNKSEYANLYDLCIVIGKEVKVGIYSSDKYSSSVLRECKILTKKYLSKGNA